MKEINKCTQLRFGGSKAGGEAGDVFVEKSTDKSLRNGAMLPNFLEVGQK